MWEEKYRDSDDYVFGKAPARFLLENPGWIRPGQDVLVVADGEGRNAVHIAACGARVCAFDFSPTAVARARALAAERGVSIEANLSAWGEWDWAGRAFDLVVAVLIQYAGPSERDEQFANLKQAVRPGGVLMLHGYRPEQLEIGTRGPKFVENMYTEDMLGEFFADWRIERLASYERDIAERRGHVGKSALIDLIARRPD